MKSRHADITIDLSPELNKETIKNKIDTHFMASSNNEIFKIHNENFQNKEKLVMLQLDFPSHPFRRIGNGKKCFRTIIEPLFKNLLFFSSYYSL